MIKTLFISGLLALVHAAAGRQDVAGIAVRGFLGTSSYKPVFNNVLNIRQSDGCDAGGKLCGSDSCIPVGDTCCSGGFGCPDGYYCQGEGCCPNGEVCDGTVGGGCTDSSEVECLNRCYPAGSTCCAITGACPAGSSCGDSGCISGGSGGSGGSTPTTPASDPNTATTGPGSSETGTGCYSDEKLCGTSDCIPIDANCCPDGGYCPSSETCVPIGGGLYGCDDGSSGAEPSSFPSSFSLGGGGAETTTPFALPSTTDAATNAPTFSFNTASSALTSRTAGDEPTITAGSTTVAVSTKPSAAAAASIAPYTGLIGLIMLMLGL